MPSHAPRLPRCPRSRTQPWAAAPAGGRGQRSTEQSPLSQTQVAEILGLDRTTILKLGAALERKGLVVRERDANDARDYGVALTPTGVRLRADAFELLLACEARFLTPLSRNERKQLHDLLARVTDL